MMFSELGARNRSRALLDRGSLSELAGPDCNVLSPHLAVQGILPQNDDGVVIGKGEMEGRAVLIISIDGHFLGGGIGEVSGAKISCALELALGDAEEGEGALPAIILFDSGGGRLPEGNYGQLAIAEIASALIELRAYVPVIGVIPGKIGAYGGMSVIAGLCSDLLMTSAGRLGLSGAKVIEQEAGSTELDSSDRGRIEAMISGKQRVAMRFADKLVEDDAEEIRSRILTVLQKKNRDHAPRSTMVEQHLEFLQTASRYGRLTPEEAVQLRLNPGTARGGIVTHKGIGSAWQAEVRHKGKSWFNLLTKDGENRSDIPSVQVADDWIGGKKTRFIAVVADPQNRFPRAGGGEVGLLEGWMIAKYVREAMEEDIHGERRAIVAIVDVPSQAFGYVEELLGIHLSLAAAVDAYAAARMAGHPIVSLLVGNANGGAFLAHGMQANRIVALDDPEVHIQVMSKSSISRVTGRSVEELMETGDKVKACAFDVRSFASLGAVHHLIAGGSAGAPGEKERDKVLAILESTIIGIESDRKRNLSSRRNSPAARNGGRTATNQVRQKIISEWAASNSLSH